MRTDDLLKQVLGYVDEASAIAKDCFARGANELGIEAIGTAAHYLRLAEALQSIKSAENLTLQPFKGTT